MKPETTIHIVERNHFPAVKGKIQKSFPELDDGAVTHAANKITNEIRRGHDCYGVDVSRRPLDNEGYYHHFGIEVSGTQIYVRLTVD